jgi:hypothetical protein
MGLPRVVRPPTAGEEVMERPVEYSSAERAWLVGLAVFGFVVLNGVFAYGLMVVPGSLHQALTNPIAASMIADTLILMGLLAYLLRKWGVSHIAWGWFVVLSLAGGMLFSLPLALLWRARRGSEAAGGRG